jgi:hypothetical protein
MNRTEIKKSGRNHRKTLSVSLGRNFGQAELVDEHAVFVGGHAVGARLAVWSVRGASRFVQIRCVVILNKKTFVNKANSKVELFVTTVGARFQDQRSRKIICAKFQDQHTRKKIGAIPISRSIKAKNNWRHISRSTKAKKLAPYFKINTRDKLAPNFNL